MFTRIPFMKLRNDSNAPELQVNLEGIDVVLICCKKIDSPKQELMDVRNRCDCNEN
jgi:hypothetical protein